MAKNSMMKLLTAPDKGIAQTHGPNGILARLFRTILFDEDITPFKYMDLMDDFIRNAQAGAPINRVDLTSWRGNLTKELGKEQMSWKVFCKALRFLQAVKIEFRVFIHWRTGRVSSHATWVDFGSREAIRELSGPGGDLGRPGASEDDFHEVNDKRHRNYTGPRTQLELPLDDTAEDLDDE